MSVRQNPETKKWEVRLQKNGKRKRYGAYDTQAIAKAKELSVIYEDRVMDYEEVEQKATWFNPLKWFKKKA